MKKLLHLQNWLLAAAAVLAGSFAASATEVTLVSPADGATLANIKDAGYFKVNVTDAPAADELEVMVRFYDPAEEFPQITGYLFPATPEEGEAPYNYAREVYEDYDMVSGVDYTLNVMVTAITYPAEGGRNEDIIVNNNYTLHGSGEAFVYSEAKLTGIDPNPVTTDIISTDQNVITLTFDAAVTITKAGMPLGFGGGLSQWNVAKANEDGTVWTIDIPTSTIENSKSSIGVSFWAQDAEGHPVYLTTVEGLPQPTQNKDNTYFNFSYVCTVGAPDFTVSPYDPNEDNLTVVQELDKFYVSYSEGIDPNWNNSLPVVLYKGKGANQTVVQQWAPDYFDMWNDEICVDYTDLNLKWCIKLDEAVTEPGAYFLVFPNAFFNLGSEFNQSLSRLTNIGYLIEEANEGDNVVTDPEAGSTVTSLKQIKITWVDASDAGVDWNVEDPVVLYDADHQVVTTASIDMSDNWDDPWNMLVVTLEEEVSAAGQYVLHIPAGKVLLNDGAKSSSELNLHYTVDAANALDSVVAANSVYTVYNLQGIQVLKTADAAQLRSLAPAIYIVNGRKVAIR